MFVIMCGLLKLGMWWSISVVEIINIVVVLMVSWSWLVCGCEKVNVVVIYIVMFVNLMGCIMLEKMVMFSEVDLINS